MTDTDLPPRPSAPPATPPVSSGAQPGRLAGPRGHLTPEQNAALLAPLARNRVQEKQGQSHLTAWDVRRWLIRIFGVGGWEFTVISCEMVHTWSGEVKKKRNGQFTGETFLGHTVIYRALGRLTIRNPAGALVAVFEDGATGDSVNQPSLGDAHDMAMKTALSQALKRCAVNLGDQFGLSLYNKGATGPVVVRSLAMPVPETASGPTAAPELGDSQVDGDAEVDRPAPPEETGPPPATAADAAEQWGGPYQTDPGPTPAPAPQQQAPGPVPAAVRQYVVGLGPDRAAYAARFAGLAEYDDETLAAALFAMPADRVALLRRHLNQPPPPAQQQPAQQQPAPAPAPEPQPEPQPAPATPPAGPPPPVAASARQRAEARLILDAAEQSALRGAAEEIRRQWRSAVGSGLLDVLPVGETTHTLRVSLTDYLRHAQAVEATGQPVTTGQQQPDEQREPFERWAGVG
jgi:hypothetical protein